MNNKTKNNNRYLQLIEKIFFDRYTKDTMEIYFERKDIIQAATAIGITIPSNLGDVLYAIRFRISMPESILKTQTNDRQWVIELAGRSQYRFRLAKINRIVPNENLVVIKIPDSTPEIISAYALNDEQALLAKVRYNRLIDIFLGLTAYSLQNHLRTSVKGVGQIEIDEVYIGLDKYGCHYIIPVQAKVGSDKISMVQTVQDTAWCRQKYPDIRCRAISAQFITHDLIALFELKAEDNKVKVVDERHYKLVSAGELDKKAVADYKL